MKKKIALIFGITGQDGSLLARFLLKKNYLVHGVKRRSSSFNTSRIDDLYDAYYKKNKNFKLHYGDVTDSLNIISLIKKIKPHEIYNLAAQSHVKVSFETPEYTANADALGCLRILEAIRILNYQKTTKLYQASTSEMFGDAKAPLMACGSEKNHEKQKLDGSVRKSEKARLAAAAIPWRRLLECGCWRL